MARDKKLIEKRNGDLYQRFLKLYEKEKQYESVVKKLGDHFYLDPETVMRIISRMTRAKEKESVAL